MARANPVSPMHEFGDEAQPAQWQALRGELVALLDQVENQYVRPTAPEPALDGLARRLRDLRVKVSETGGEARHEEALRSVKRAVDRFSEREEIPATVRETPVPHRNPRDTLQSAIDEIRSQRPAMRETIPAARNNNDQDDQRRRAEMAQREQQDKERQMQAERIERLVGAVGGLSGRLEQLESELKSQGGRNEGVREIGQQVAQLAGVVEMLAGAVGETGQVKRLEAQIQALSKAMDQGPKVDLSALTQRISDLSHTVERLADMQAQQLTRDKAGHPQAAMLQDGMRSVEASVRNVYDRIDSIEKNYLLSPNDFERLTEEMASFTRAMREHQPEPLTLIARVDALYSRIDELDGRNGILGELREDVSMLRGAVVSTFEPRFSALEDQIASLSNKVGGRQPADPNISEIQDQIRLLLSRMDDTGEQLSGLARLYAEGAEKDQAPDYQALAQMVARETSEAMTRNQVREPALDYDALATLVARKTSEAVTQKQPREPAPNFEHLATLVASKTSEAMARSAPAPVNNELSEAGLDALEERMSRLFTTTTRESAPEDLSHMNDGIRRVDERLERLEAALERSNKAQLPLSTALELTPAPAPMPAQPKASVRDMMPRNPDQDAPLLDKGFASMGSVRDVLAGRSGPEAQAGITVPSRTEAVPPQVDLSRIERPARPESSLGGAGREAYATSPEPMRNKPEADEALPGASRNTFIEAARRAAQRQNGPKAEVATNSLIGRALSRFQPSAQPPAIPEGSKMAETAKPAPMVAAMEPVEPAKKGRPIGKRKAKIEDEAAKPAAPTRPAFADDDLRVDPIVAAEGEKQSFLLRHRKPILLTAATVAVSLMTLNLVGQRMALAPQSELTEQTEQVQSQGELESPVIDAAPEAIEALPQTSPSSSQSTPVRALSRPAQLSSLAGPRIIPATDSAGVDPTPVGSIDPKALLNFPAAARDTEATPDIEVSSIPEPQPTSALDTVPEAQVQAAASGALELPPEGLGPEALRQAAAGGDMRAQFEVAAIYTEGRAVTQDFAAAATWYERAAAQGFAPAQYRLGSLYESGKGVEKDLEQARLWYTRAAEAGNRMSMHNLAALYAGGELGAQDFASASRWFEEAASRGMTDSQFNLGMLYARGLGVAQNMETSYKWFSLAAVRGDADAVKARDDMAKSLDADAMGRVSAELAIWKQGSIDLAANFAPIGTWSTQFDPGAPIDSAEIIEKVQAALSRLGYDVGTPDGVMGPKTGEAIKSFERATGMSEVGAINPRLLAVLGSQPV